MQPIPIAVNFHADIFTVELSNGRVLSVPYAVSPKLLAATFAQREAVRLSRTGLHWDQLDEDLGIKGLLRDAFLRERLQSVERAVKVDIDDL